MQGGLSIDLALKIDEFVAFEYVLVVLEKLPNCLDEMVVGPMDFHRFYPHLDLTVVFSICFAVNVNVEQRLSLPFQSPCMQALMEGTMRKICLREVIGIQIFLNNLLRRPPEDE